MTTDPRRLWEIYTPRNIKAEIAHRFARYRRLEPTGTPQPIEAVAYDDGHARRVGAFYDSHHEQFLRVYGPVIQAFRTRDVTDLLNYQIERIGFRSGQRVLDAGCGVAAPAIHFARHAGVRVDAITVSSRQSDAARENVIAAGLAGCVTIVHGDYHRLPDYFAKGSYDAVYFLESFGHSREKARLVGVCREMLKPGGTLYIKDLFTRVARLPEHREPMAREVRKINDAYHYEVGDLNAVLDAIRGSGLILESLNSVNLEASAFEDLAISNEFQELTGIARIENWNEYIFPVDFFEIRCVKPEFDLDERPDRHFLQSRMHHQVE